MRDSKWALALSAAALSVTGCGSEKPAQPGVVAAERPLPLPATSSEPIAVTAKSGGGLIPPGAVIGSDSPTGEGVVVVIQSRERPERLAAWYRSPERDPDFQLGSELREGAEQVLTGSLKPKGEFTVRLAPGINSGTTATIIFTGS